MDQYLAGAWQNFDATDQQETCYSGIGKVWCDKLQQETGISTAAFGSEMKSVGLNRK